MHCKPHRAPDLHMGWGTETGIWDKRRDENSVLFREPPAFLKLILQHASLLLRGPSTSSAQWLSVHSRAKGFSDPSGNWRSKDSTPNHVYPSRYCRTQPTNGSHTCCWPEHCRSLESDWWLAKGSAGEHFPESCVFNPVQPLTLVYQAKVIHLTVQHHTGYGMHTSLDPRPVLSGPTPGLTS